MFTARRSLLAVVSVLAAVSAAAGPAAAGPATAGPATAGPAGGDAGATAALPDPSDFSTDIDNPYFPLRPGTTNVYTGEKDGKSAYETHFVTDQTELIIGVSTRVVLDRLYLDGYLAEDTQDWYTQDSLGNVWYFGEDTRTLDRFGHVLSREGSFRAGVDGALPGIFMPAHPRVGQTFQQEFYPGQAEDRAVVLSLDATVTVPAGTFRNTLQTREWTPLEPGVRSDKNFAVGIGTVKEIDVVGGDEHLELLVVLHEQLN